MPDRYSAEASAQILRTGGNAIDAAITAVFVLAVSYPQAGNIGGGGYQVQANSWGNLGDIQAIYVTGDKVQATADNRATGVTVLIN